MKKNISIKEKLTLAYQHHKKNEFKIAENFYKDILKVNPVHFETNYLLGSLYLQIKNFKKSEQLLKKAIKINHNYSNAHNNLGIVLGELHQFKKAVDSFKKAINIQPTNSKAYNNLGKANKELGKLNEAVNFFKKAIEVKPNYAQAYNNLGSTLEDLGSLDKPKEYYEKAIEIKPDFAEAHRNLGIEFKKLGQTDKAINCFEKAVKFGPGKLVHFYYLSEFKEEILNLKLKKLIMKTINMDGVSKSNVAYGYYLLSKYEHKTKNYKKEIDYLKKGHSYYFKYNKKNFRTKKDDWFNEIPMIRKIDNLGEINKKAKEISYKIKPIFIVGVPRCGSTMIEKIIASGVENVPIGEETNILHNLIKKKILKTEKFVINIEEFKNKAIENYKKEGLVKIENNYTFTDKSLENFFYLNLIKKIFPYAKVIDCRRNVLASIVSIFQNNLTQLSWTHSLENIFEYFDNYFKKIKEFKKNDPNFIYELQYEKFVNDPNNESKNLLRFCDLAWDKKCLEFYKRKDLISKTTSNVQIRQAIYKHSLDKYLPYKKFLEKYGSKYSWFN